MSPKLVDGNLHVSLTISFSHAIQAFITSPMLVVYTVCGKNLHHGE